MKLDLKIIINFIKNNYINFFCFNNKYLIILIYFMVNIYFINNRKYNFN